MSGSRPSSAFSDAMSNLLTPNRLEQILHALDAYHDEGLRSP